mmetsp:Transcript_38/g.85  ORF Transcript_38/g.85 Transcript_38/m.85 type:complete len:279 (-) Transcript_38:206-1042(-)
MGSSLTSFAARVALSCTWGAAGAAGLGALGLAGLYYRNPLSFRTKFHMLLSPEIPEDLRAMEWMEYIRYPRSKVLVVAFAGGGVMIGGIPLPEWAKTCSRIEGIDYLTVVDVHQKWYLQQHNKWRERFRSLFAKYEKVLLLGNCMGATGAMLFADMADSVVAFAPQTCLKNAKGVYWLNSLRLSNEMREGFNRLLRRRASECKRVSVIYSPLKDSYFAKYLPEHWVTMEKDCDELNVPVWLKKNGKLVSMLSDEIDALLKTEEESKYDPGAKTSMKQQ